MMSKSIRPVIAMILCSLFAGTVQAQLVFHYDPDTGNVSFDTSNTRNGSALSFGLDFTIPIFHEESPLECHLPAGDIFCDHNPSGIEFIPENYINLSQSTILEVNKHKVSEFTFGTPWQGVYTIGNILPPNLDEDTWKSLFSEWGLVSTDVRLGYTTGHHFYNDVIGGGDAPTAEFVYGAPDAEFQNRFDLVDPETLDWAEEAQLVYRQSTGELLLDTSGENGGYSTIFLIGSDHRFQPENFTPPFTGPLNTATTDSILVAGDAFEPGVYNLGNVLPADLSFEEFSDLITDASFVGRAGFGSQVVALSTDALPLGLVFEVAPSLDQCDLDGDGDCDTADLDLLYASADSINQTQINDWLTAASLPENPAKSDPSDVYQIGDINLNGAVDSEDLGLLLNNFNDEQAASWSQGNVNGTQGVNSSDLGLLLNSINQASPSAVPEPSGATLMFMVLAMAVFHRSSRGS